MPLAIWRTEGWCPAQRFSGSLRARSPGTCVAVVDSFGGAEPVAFYFGVDEPPFAYFDVPQGFPGVLTHSLLCCSFFWRGHPKMAVFLWFSPEHRPISSFGVRKSRGLQIPDGLVGFTSAGSRILMNHIRIQCRTPRHEQF